MPPNPDLHVLRSVRNRNPGNLRYSAANRWQGQTGHDAQGFARFSSYSYGWRALLILLDTYRVHDECNTTRKIILRYAPPMQNPTEAYIHDVVEWSGMVSPDALVIRGDIPFIAHAIARQESGAMVNQMAGLLWACNDQHYTLSSQQELALLAPPAPTL